jgi:hypothetical protein
VFLRGDRRLEDAEAAQFREEEEGPRETDSERQERRSFRLQTRFCTLYQYAINGPIRRKWKCIPKGFFGGVECRAILEWRLRRDAGEYHSSEATTLTRNSRRSETTVVVLGTGRMGKALARVWARGGYRVIIGSRDFTRGKLTAGEVSKECGARVEGGEQAWAVQRGDIIVLATPFCETGEILAGLRGHLVGKGKIFIDVTNAEYDSQSIEHTAGVEINRYDMRGRGFF